MRNIAKNTKQGRVLFFELDLSVSTFYSGLMASLNATCGKHACDRDKDLADGCSRELEHGRGRNSGQDSVASSVKLPGFFVAMERGFSASWRQYTGQRGEECSARAAGFHQVHDVDMGNGHLLVRWLFVFYTPSLF
jgi:hypothetical protein